MVGSKFCKKEALGGRSVLSGVMAVAAIQSDCVHLRESWW